MNEHFKRILDDAATRLDTSLKDAQNAVARAKKEMTALAEFSEHLPHAFLDKFNHLMVGEYQFNEKNWTPEATCLNVAYHRVPLNPAIQNPLVGKYRVIVLLQKVD